MAKKRKAPSFARSEELPFTTNPDIEAHAPSRKRITTFEDVADSDDEFHLGRDAILLDEGPEAKRRRKVMEEEAFLEEEGEEVLGVEDEDDEEEEDEEVDGSDGSGDERSEHEEDALGWSTAKDDIYGADEIETEEQALEEEAEALRLQRKQLQALTAADYGFDEGEWKGEADEEEEDADARVVTETLPQLQVGKDMLPAERLKLLHSRYPEFEPLSNELLQILAEQRILSRDIVWWRKQYTEDSAPNLTAKIRAASAYAGALTMYFALLTSPAAEGDPHATALSAVRLRDHPVMDALVRCRELWSRAKDLPIDAEPVQTSRQVLSGTNDEVVSKKKSKKNNKAVPVKKSRAEKHAEATRKAAEARKAERMEKVEADLMDLDSLIKGSRKTRSKRPANDADSDIGDETPLTAQELAEKAKKKKSLRFYTSQIAQKANKRGAAGRNAGGDDDIPHRERLKDRQARLNAEAEKRGQRNTQPSAADLGGDSDEEDAKQAQAIRATAGGDDDGYYDLIASRTARRKADKAALTAAQKQAAESGGRVVPEEIVGVDGKRKITYAIEKNKGLTPHRKKEVRNPRVKKRKKYDEKKKKLASTRAVFKGGEGRGGYGGELTGIKGGLVRSVKL
ncbi:Sas10 C-terminal domain-containing protein [Neohortaea acidophila]|uniref:Sas10 C-terminal domain-containing protein n=1 Tax=Neohortaea acidophila TaxID=245834 RepID=A0A6A6Q3J7_9PEZI|nr:Sas10 C-terminal domain-containing protein [Neohortaea acidophila]KAF2486852.1 Sas10 C-terminal domain-containing protein [Neohortaea acidophila]